jgi:hypothetical protein
VGKADRKGAGDFGRSYSMPSQDIGESLGKRVLSRPHSFFLIREVKEQISPSGPSGPVDF